VTEGKAVSLLKAQLALAALSELRARESEAAAKLLTELARAVDGALAAGVCLLGEPRSRRGVLPDDREAVALLDHVLYLDSLVSRSDEEEKRAAADALIGRERNLQPFRAGAVGALADELGRATARDVMCLLDALVHLPKEGFVPSGAFFPQVHRCL
jgi:hypothetical protein